MQIFEAIMLVCFGLGWPVSIFKTWKTKKVAGKSLLFLGIIWTGYMSGIIHKVFTVPDWVTVFYCVNVAMVTIDFLLYWKYKRCS